MSSPRCQPIPMEQRFWKHVAKGEGCWEWTGSLYRNGYGRACVRHGKFTLAHRVAFRLTHGEIPEGLNICHTCDNRKCVRPEHLYAGTQQQNVDDMVRRGRQRHAVQTGTMHGMAILTEEDVAEIRRLFSIDRKEYVGPGGKRHTLGKYSKARIARMFHVSHSTIASAVNGRNWKHVHA
jgi:hypothetical protein